MRHRKMAEDCWRLIKALADKELSYVDDLDDVDDAAVNLIEMACDSAAESQRVADGYPPEGARHDGA